MHFIKTLLILLNLEIAFGNGKYVVKVMSNVCTKLLKLGLFKGCFTECPRKNDLIINPFLIFWYHC